MCRRVVRRHKRELDDLAQKSFGALGRIVRFCNRCRRATWAKSSVLMLGDIFELRIIYNFGIAPYHYSGDVICFNLLANSLPKILAFRIFYFSIIWLIFGIHTGREQLVHARRIRTGKTKYCVCIAKSKWKPISSTYKFKTNKSVLCWWHIHKSQIIAFAVLKRLACANCLRPVTSACLHRLDDIQLI